MTLPQALSFAIVTLMLGLFLWDRLRFDMVALLALLAAIACGVVPVKAAFLGFSNPVVIIIASALVLSRAIAVTGIAARMVRRLGGAMSSTDRAVGALAFLVAGLSALMKNVGALAIFIPVAVEVAERRREDRHSYLMPLSFASLAGGLMTLIGTSPNLLISTVRQQATGHPYRMFDFAPVGVPLAILAVAFLSVGWRLIPARRSPGGTPSPSEAYTTELRIPAGSSLAGQRLDELERLAGGEVNVTTIVRDAGQRRIPAGHWILHAGDILVIESEPARLEQLMAETALELVGDQAEGSETEEGPGGDIGTVEAVVGERSALIGNSATDQALRDRYHVNLLAIGRRGRRIDQALRQTRFHVGDLVVLEGSLDTMPDTLAALGCFALVDRSPQLGRRRRPALPLIIVVGAMGLAALQAVPVEIAFFGAAVLVVLLRLLTLKEAYDAVDWPVVILLGCLIPVGQAIHDTGGSLLVARLLAGLAHGLPPYAIVALLLVVSMLVTPVLHHAAAVLVMGPIAAGLATQLGLQVDPFLMAVAVGASCDFLTPIGHQCNALVMGPGGYRFRDYWHLGLPLSAIVVLVGVPLITLVWPPR